MRRGALLRRLQHRQRGALSTLPDQTLSVIDQALWDLVGRRLGEPVWKLLGGVRDRVQAYASTMCGDEMEGGLRTPEDYATFAEKLRTQGYAAIKIHTWMPPVSFAPSIAMDIAACEAVREAVGPDYPLMLDSNHWYSRTEALELGRALDRLRFFWYEEPMSEYSIQSYRWLAKRVRTPLIGPESVEGRLQTRAEWISAQACDIVRVGVERSGGIESALHTAILAEAFGMECELHGGGAGTLAVLGAVDNGRWYERGLLHPLVDFEVLPPHLLRRVDVMDTSGYINLPEAPGLGEQFNLDYITATAIERR
jgi:L-alanine-DL-glutamate epimerase-like enolase superfamily enzyme